MGGEAVGFASGKPASAKPKAQSSLVVE